MTSVAPPVSARQGSVLQGYVRAATGRDEMVARDGSIRTAWRPMGQALAQMDLRELRSRRNEVVRLLEDDGVSYHVPGTGERRRWLLDPLPMVIGAEDWAAIESGVIQRAELLNLILTDLYGARRLLREGLIPPELVRGHPGFLRPLDGQRLPIRQQLFTYAVDLARDPEGGTIVLTDRTQAPSGAAYALQNRVVTSRVFSQLHRASHVQRLAPYFRALRQGLQQAAPHGVTLPRTVLLTPGSRNETAFEHAFLAARLGVSLVEGSDLAVRDGRVWLRTLGHLEPVDVILRRMDEDFCDPLELRGSSLIGVPGLVQSVRTGVVSVVNTLGSGVLENPALQAFLPSIAQVLLGQALRLPAVRTLWLGDPEARREVLAAPSTWVFKPTHRTSGQDRAVFAAGLTDRQLQALMVRVSAAPRRWVAQEPQSLASAPTLTGDGLAPRGTLLRTFAVASGDSYTVMPGGLTRVAPERGPVGTDPQGTVSKDTWVLAGKPEPLTGFWMDSQTTEPVAEFTIPSRAAENLYWLGRYAERAEGVARLLREVDDRRTEFTDTPVNVGQACVNALLQALTHVTTTYPGFVGPGADARIADPEPELDMLAGDDSRPGTLAHAIRHLLDAVDAVRDLLSGDTWLVVVDLQRLITLTDQSGRGAVPASSAVQPAAHRGAATDTAKILHGLLAIQGLGAENMVRDAGWHFMDAGRRLERSLQMIALLRATTTHVRATAEDSLVLESVLRVAESIVTYRRRYRSHARVGTLLDLLLLDPDNPRSLSYQLEQLTEDLRRLPGHPGAGRVSASERAVLEASTALRVADTQALSDAVEEGIHTELDDFLGHLHTLLLRAAADISVAHFTHVKRQRQMQTGGTA
ncbi:circularly permuted type 2 ATP-grasp protein [soil metagenome]